MPNLLVALLLLVLSASSTGEGMETRSTRSNKNRVGKGTTEKKCSKCTGEEDAVSVDGKSLGKKIRDGGSRPKKTAKGNTVGKNRITDCAAVSLIVPPRMHRSRGKLGLPLDIGLGQELVRRAFRLHAREVHPDMLRHQNKNGSHADWFAVAQARTDLLETINATGEDSLVGRALVFDKIEGYKDSRPAFQTRGRDGKLLYLYYLPARDCWVVGHNFGGAGSALALLPLEFQQDMDRRSRPTMAWDEPQFWLAATSDGKGGIDWVGQPKAQAHCVLTDEGRRQLIIAATALMNTVQAVPTSTSPTTSLLMAFDRNDPDWLEPWRGRSQNLASEYLDQFGAIRLVRSICGLLLIQNAMGEKGFAEPSLRQHERQKLADICVGKQERRIAERLLRSFASHPAPPLHILKEHIPSGYHPGDIVDSAALLAGDDGIVVTSAMEDLHRRDSLKDWLAAPGTESFFTSPASVFACISDPFDDVLHNVNSLKRVMRHTDQPQKVDVFVSVVGGLSAFNYLLAFEPGAVEFFDVSQYALRYGRMVVEIIRASSTRQEFISHLFSRSLAEFERTDGSLTAQNQLSFLRLPPQEELRNQTRRFLSDDGARAFREVILEHQRISFNDSSWRQGIVKLNPEKYYRYVTQLAFPCEEEESSRYPSPSGLGRIHNSCTCYTCGSREETLQVVQQQDKCATWLRSWVNNCSFHYGAGWLQDAASFNRVRRILSTVPVLFRNVDVLDPAGKFCATDAAPQTSPAGSRAKARTIVASTMDIFGVWNNFIDVGTTYRLQRHWAASCGASNFILLQTLVFKSNLCRHWVRGSGGHLDYTMQSCSEWS